jgi:hypothetical protein
VKGMAWNALRSPPGKTSSPGVQFTRNTRSLISFAKVGTFKKAFNAPEAKHLSKDTDAWPAMSEFQAEMPTVWGVVVWHKLLRRHRMKLSILPSIGLHTRGHRAHLDSILDSLAARVLDWFSSNRNRSTSALGMVTGRREQILYERPPCELVAEVVVPSAGHPSSWPDCCRWYRLGAHANWAIIAHAVQQCEECLTQFRHAHIYMVRLRTLCTSPPPASQPRIHTTQRSGAWAPALLPA